MKNGWIARVMKNRKLRQEIRELALEKNRSPVWALECFWVIRDLSKMWWSACDADQYAHDTMVKLLTEGNIEPLLLEYVDKVPTPRTDSWFWLGHRCGIRLPKEIAKS